MEDIDWMEPVGAVSKHDCQTSSSKDEEQLRAIFYEVRKLSSERDTSQVCVVICMGYDEDRTTNAQLWQVFSSFGRIRRLDLGNRSATIEYEEASSARQAVAARIDFYGRRLLIIYSEKHLKECPVRPRPPA